jgi:hypothetical protein
MVKDGKSAEDIRIALQQLTPQPVGAKLDPTETTTERSSMDEQFGTGPTGEQDGDTAAVSAEGTGNTADQDATDEALETEREGVDEAGAKRRNPGYGSGF